MGKWANVNLPEGFEKRLEEMKHLTDDQIHDLWIKNGSLSLGDFSNMGWYWSSINSWACIDNCEGKNAPATFKVFCNYKDYLNDPKRIVFEKMCIVLASEMGALREVSIEHASETRQSINSTLASLDIIDVEFYNDPSHASFIRDYKQLFDLCRNCGANLSLHFIDENNKWHIAITYYHVPGLPKTYITDESGLSIVMKDAIDYVSNL